MQFYRFMSADRFLSELKPLRAYRTEFMGTGLLERLNQHLAHIVVIWSDARAHRRDQVLLRRQHPPHRPSATCQIEFAVRHDSRVLDLDLDLQQPHRQMPQLLVDCDRSRLGRQGQEDLCGSAREKLLGRPHLPNATVLRRGRQRSKARSRK